jgi:Sulfotransferase family
MKQIMSVEEVVEEARRRTGLHRFDAETFREGLEIFLTDFGRQTPLPEWGVARTREAVVAALATRLKVNAYLENHPELLDRPVERPVFVFGIPRTGTTLLSNLLAADPNRRSPLTWEIDDPVPPPTSATLYTDARALARLEQERVMLAANPEAGKYYRFSAIYPNECLFFMGHDFKNNNWESRGRLPNYRDYLYGSVDMQPAYQYHKRFLQLLQSKAPGIWNLKMPSHANYLETLIKVYPDARLIWTHRDPLTATGSLCSLISNGSRMMIGHADDLWIGENKSFQAQTHVERIMNFRDKFGEDRVIDVHYADLMRDPIPAMRTLYAALGDEYTPEAEAGMRAWLAENPQDKFGRHAYKLDRYGLSRERLIPLFERYLSRYAVESEGQ